MVGTDAVGHDNYWSWQGTTREDLHKEYRAQGVWGETSLSSLLADACRGDGAESRFIVVSGHRPADVTFGELRESALRLAAGLRTLGVTSGTRVAMHLPNILEACLCFHACAALGAPLVPILHLLGADETSQIVADSGASVLVVADAGTGNVMNRSGTIRTVLDQCSTVTSVVVVGDGWASDDPRVRSIEELLLASPLPEHECFAAPDDPSVIAYTSGATGRPKGVVHSQNSMLAAVNAMVDGFGGAAHHIDVGMNPNPVGHATGLFVTCVLPFVHQFRAMLLLDRWDPDEMLSLIEQQGVTVVGGAPVFLQAILRSKRLRERDTTSLRAFLLGGDTVTASLVEEADAHGITALRAYGLTEHASVAMSRHDDPLDDRARTDGRIVSGTDLKVVLSEGTGGIASPGQAGEIHVRGPAQCIGVIAGERIVSATMDGWLATGDLGRLDELGRLTIEGRIKDVIIRGGEKISCSEVEAALLRHGDVIDAAVAGVSHPVIGQQVAAFVVARRGAQLTLPNLARHCIDLGLAAHKVPKRLRLVATVPRSFVGKIQRRRLAEQYFGEEEDLR